jgi:hypothetical protein
VQGLAASPVAWRPPLSTFLPHTQTPTPPALNLTPPTQHGTQLEIPPSPPPLPPPPPTHRCRARATWTRSTAWPPSACCRFTQYAQYNSVYSCSLISISCSLIKIIVQMDPRPFSIHHA